MMKSNKLDAKFSAYHENNPEIYKAFKASARQLHRAGRSHFGAKCIMEHIRFQTAVTGTGVFKINNNYTSRYVRLLEKECPEFVGFFSKRSIETVTQRSIFDVIPGSIV